MHETTQSLIIALLLLVNSFCARLDAAAKSYKFRLSVDIPIGLISLGTGGAGLILHKKTSAWPIEEINNLKPTDVSQL